MLCLLTAMLLAVPLRHLQVHGPRGIHTRVLREWLPIGVAKFTLKQVLIVKESISTSYCSK